MVTEKSGATRGFVAFSVMLVLSAMALALVMTTAYLGVGEAKTGLTGLDGTANLRLVEGCVEDYLLIIKTNPSYTGGNISRPEGVCSITINSGNPNWDITVGATGVEYLRKIRVVFVRNTNGIALTSWREI